MDYLKRLLKVLFLVGWGVPLLVGIDAYLAWTSQHAAGRENLNSFPYLHFSKQMVAVGSVWLMAALVVRFWRRSERS